jgi:predicted transcriptional regulator
MQTAKQDVEHLLHQLPDDSTLEDIQYHLYVLDKVKRGQAAIANGKRYTSEEARARLGRWTTP